MRRFNLRSKQITNITTITCIKHIFDKMSDEFPLNVLYCGNCSLPIEYCEYHPEYEKCKQWLQNNMPLEYKKMMQASENPQSSTETSEGRKRQKRGGKGNVKSTRKLIKPSQVCVSRAPRGKKKSMTVITGLSTFKIDLKLASRYFGVKFACGSSITGDDEIVIQGDVKDELLDIIPNKWPEVIRDSILDLGDLKR